MTRLFFCTDLHGSEVCFRKFLHAGRVYEAGVVMMGGDCTGKMIIPLVHTGNGTYHCDWSGGTQDLSGEDLQEEESAIRNNGLYPVRMEPGEFDRLQSDPDRLKELFHDVMMRTLRDWVGLAESRLGDEDLKVIFTPGNDDDYAVDDVLDESDFVEAPEGRVTTIDDRHEMLSIGWSNPTPWDTPREYPEDELAGRIAELAGQIGDMDSAIFNIHVPPYDTGLDNAPELVDATRTRRGGAIMKAVGSTAVRDAILEHQPMLSLHGHIHESRGVQRLGRTTCINPGSTYSEMILQGVVVDVDASKVTRYVLTTG